MIEPCMFIIDRGEGRRWSCGATATEVVASMTGWPLYLCSPHAAEERQIQPRVAASKETTR